ncbi:MAG: hypothetical protein IJ666_07265 [Ruminococcus sp.]|nr:hypothetical protein [Ruminococcus sp.]
MKKYLSLALGLMLSAMACVSCQEENNEDTPEIPENAVEEPVTEIPFRELNERDFSKINMNLRYSEGECPIEVTEKTLSNLDFGQKMSPCKAEEVRADYRPTDYDDPALDKEVIERYNKICETPSSGEISEYASSENAAFFEVNFDDYCGRHCSSLFAYDYDTDTLRELSSKEGLEEGKSYDYGSLYYANDMLICYNRETINNHENQTTETILHIMQIDTETGKETEILSGDYDFIYSINHGKMILQTFVIGDEVKDISETGIILTEYDFSTGETRLISESDSFVNDMRVFFDDGSTGSIVRDEENDTVTFTTDDINLVTEHKKITDTFLWKDKAVVITNDALMYTDSYVMYTYDFDRMECLISKLDGFGRNFAQMGEGLVATSYGGWEGSKSPINYIAPESGAVFRLAETNSGNINNVSDIFTFLERPAHTYDQYGMRVDDNNECKIYSFKLMHNS